MWFCVVFRETNGSFKKEILFTWVHSLDIVQIFNRGISNSKNHLVYYSQDKNDDPNFKLPIRDFFDENDQRGCYYAKIRLCAGTFHFTYIYFYTLNM